MQVQDIFFNLDGDLSKYDDVVSALVAYFQPSTNVLYENIFFEILFRTKGNSRTACL